ncbi:MAG: cation:proton antiporter [Bacteroidales bacterium]|jgi:Kef-type K+ transport system membrane component KefB/nucleotide-binding universal stress UspA family protein|nr:cation:proton antiporter [Bacteroidales bacterium]
MQNMHLPIENPVIVLALCLFIMLVVPSACKRIGMPSIFGLILSGIIIGPKGFNLIGEGSGLELLSTAGLMYLMFMMTLEIDMFGFRKNKFKSVWFGICTFVIPFVLGFVLSYYVFSFNITASLLLACMFSTHTLVSYPIASRLNITKAEPVVVSIGGTIITDMAVLMFLTIIITYYEGVLSVFFWVKTIVLLGALMFVMFWCFPKICRWYFSHFQSDDTAQYIFVLTSLFMSGFLAELAGIEAIVGAFMCGLVLNRTIPHQSTLMTRTIFIGNSVFVPFFLIYIGMLVDVRAFFKGFDTLIFAATLVFVALLSKYIAAFVMQLLYRYTRAERLLFFGLSCSHAAATIAVVIVGYRMEIFNEQIINGTVLIILFTCLISTYLTDYAGRLVALQQKKHDVKDRKSDRILVPVSNPETALTLFDFAIMINQSNSNSSVTPLTIATNPQQLEQSILKEKSFVDYFVNQANAANVRYMPAMRIDSNISEGIIHAAMEIQVTHIVLGWSGQSGTAKYFFGTIIEKLLENCPQTLMVVNMKTKIVMFRKIYVLIPNNAGHEAGFKAWMLLLHTLHRNISGELLFIADKDTVESITSMNKTMSFSEKHIRFFTETPNMQIIAGELKENDLLVVILARPNTVSYSRKLAVMPRVITRYFSHTNSMILYPEQVEILHDKIGVNFGII